MYVSIQSLNLDVIVTLQQYREKTRKSCNSDKEPGMKN